MKDLEEKARQVRLVAEELVDRLRKLQEWLASLPGRVATEIPADGTRPALAFRRKGKGWEIAYQSGEEWKPIGDAPLAIKMAALKEAPTFLLAMRKSQDVLISQLQSTMSEFDAWFNHESTSTAEKKSSK